MNNVDPPITSFNFKLSLRKALPPRLAYEPSITTQSFNIVSPKSSPKGSSSPTKNNNFDDDTKTFSPFGQQMRTTFMSMQKDSLI